MRTKAVVLSVLIAGLGQAYMGRFGRAFIWFAGAIGVTVALENGDATQAARGGFSLAIGLLSGIDAAIIAPNEAPEDHDASDR